MASSPKKKIALVYDAVYPDVIGGAQRRFFELGHELTRGGYEVHLYSMKYWTGPTVIERDGLILHGLCQARPLYTRTGRRSILQPIIFGLSCLKLVGQPFDMIDCCGFPYFSLFSAKLAALIRRKPLYATWHEVWGQTYWREYLGRLGFIGYLIEKIASALPDHIIAVSEQTRQRLVTKLHYSKDITVIPNGVDITAIAQAPASSTASDVIYFGRLVEFKHVDTLIEAVAKLKPTNPAIRCLIVGDGPERANLEAHSRRLGLATNVTFTGVIPEPANVYSLIKASKVFVLPSTREGFGISIIEANAAGIPAITTAHPDNAAANLITPGVNGHLAEPNAASFAARIAQVLQAPATLHPRTHIERYTWSQAANMVQKLISDQS